MDLVVRELSKYLEEEEVEIQKLEEEKLQDFPDVLEMVYDFEAASKSRMWMRQIIINQAKEETDDEEITEEEYKHMLKMHKMEQRIKLSVESDPTTNRFKYYSSDVLTHENKWPSHYKTFKITKKKSKNPSKDVKNELKDLDVFPDLTMDLPSATGTGTVKSENLPDSNVPSEKSVVKKRKVDVDVLRKRIWRFIARKEIPKAYRQKCQLKATSFLSSRKFCKEIVRKGRCNAVASQKFCKETVSRARRLSRETQMFWKRYNKVEKTHRKKAEKHALEQRKIDEGIREAKRQQRKLNFLISQTELFAHFLSKKIKQTAEVEQNYNERKQKILNALTDDFAESTYAIESLGGHGNADIAKLEAEAIKEQALKTVDDALRLHRNMQQDFQSNESDEKIPEDVIEAKSLSQPTIFRGTLKTYQVKGMSWLVNLYQQGISGILADEMGLGKTVQTIAFLAHLAESIGIWGPFLVIAPASTLNNWHQEFTRFLPDFKVLPYWGNPNDRKVLRKFWSQATTCTDKETAPFHVLVTSYQLVISDVRCFQRVKWQFMVLDEAQALKSSTSARWKTLLEFQCRNRLLLTGTPIQNTMAELWALLHFIMPSLFDSHNEFNEWFSKDIENHIENKSSIDEKQLSRLHLILKPFMLRRIKKDVENELSEKIEVRVNCSMSPRQCRLYKALQQNLKLEDLLRTAGNSSSAPGNTTLMNLVMQFRKTCNHPDLFERREVVSPIKFKMPTLLVPKLVFHEGFLSKSNPTHKKLLYHDMNIHSQHNIFELKDQGHSLLSFIDFWDISYTDYCNILLRNSFIGRLNALHKEIKQQVETQNLCSNGIATKSNKMVLNNLLVRKHHICFTNTNNPVYQVTTGCDINLFEAVDVPKFYLDLYLPRVLCNPCSIYCNDRAATTYFTDCKTRSGRFKQDTLICLFGVDVFNKLIQTEHTNPWLKWNKVKSTNASGFFHNPVINSGISCLAENWSKICIPSKEYLVSDSGKMFALDFLLKRLKMENHRVLIYSQMTKMIDLLEEYMLYRKHTYIRLDGSSRISDRRDMVADFQKRDDIFVFLLSTRAGGLGINLTAADTVIFYDSDWNPTVDQQAMDRAHRLGQTKQVTVYRLVCQGTVDERILQRAEEKNIIQKMVISGGHFKQENLKTKEVVSLLLDDEQMIKKWNANKDEVKKQQYKGKKRGRKSNAEKEMEQAKRMRALQRDSPLLEDISAPTSAEPTPVPSPQSSSSQDAFMQDEDSIIVVDDEDLAPSRIAPKPRGRGRGRPRIRPIQAESSKKRGSRNAGRARGTASNRRGRKPVRGRAAEIAGARAGAVAASAAAYAAYGYQYQDGNYNPDSNQ